MSDSIKFTQQNKVLLIIHDVYQEDNHFPLGPAYIAATLRDYGAFVETYCMDLFHYTNDELEQKLQTDEYDLIGVGFMAARFNETIRDLCNVINKNKKDAWLVLGGHGPSPIAEYILGETKADVVVSGAGEETTAELLDRKLKGSSIDDVLGITFFDGKNYIATPERPLLRKLDDNPLPAWDLFPIEEYSWSVKYFGQSDHELSLCFITGRGCSDKCAFCYRLEKGLRARSIPKVVEEIKILYDRYGITAFYIMDDLFAFSTKRVLLFEKELKDNGLTIKYGCDARVDHVIKDGSAMVESLKRSGCKFINLGLESSSNEVLALMDKRATLEDNIKALDIVTGVGISIGLNFIWNNPGDTEKSLRDNVDLIKKYNDFMQLRTIRPVTPYPGSPLFYTAIEKGLLKGPGDFFDKFVNSDLILVNFTDLPLQKCYDLLLEANTELIKHHYQNTNGDMDEAKRLIQDFSDLYSGKITNFRGARHYDNKVMKNPTERIGFSSTLAEEIKHAVPPAFPDVIAKV